MAVTLPGRRHPAWWIIVTVILAVSHLCVAAAVLAKQARSVSTVACVMVLAPLGSFVSLLQRRQSEDGFGYLAEWRLAARPPRAVAEELDRTAVAWGSPTLRTILNANLELVAHTLSGALPLGVVYLLAVSTTSNDDDSTVALLLAIAMVCATLCITGILFCRAFTLRVVVFQAACVVFDVASTFYTGATLFAVQTEHDTTWLGVGVSWQGSVLLWKGLVLYSFIVISLTLCAIADWISRVYCSDPFRLVRGVVGILTSGALLWGPVALLSETTKLSWMLPFMQTVAPRGAAVRFVSFCDGGHSVQRTRYMWNRLSRAGTDEPHDEHCTTTPLQGSARLVNACLNRVIESLGFNDTRGVVLVRGCVHVLHPSQAISIAYVVVTGARQYFTHTTLQAVFFYASCGSLLTVFLLARYTWIHVQHCAAVMEHVVPPSSILLDWMNDYFVPSSHRALTQHGVAKATLPPELTSLVATYLAGGDIDTSQMPMLACEEFVECGRSL